MEGIARTVSVIGTVFTGTALSEIGSVYLKTVFPHILKIIAANVALNKLGAALDVKAGTDVAVIHDTCGIDARITKKVPFADFTLVIKRKKVGTTVGDFHLGLEAVLFYEIKNVSILVF